MKKKVTGVSWVLLSILIVMFPAFGLVEQDDLESLIGKIKERLDSYPELTHWRASVISTITKVDKDWNPQKITVVSKVVETHGKESSEEILEAREEEKGETKDITQKFRQEEKERREKAEKKRRKREKEGKEEQEGSITLSEEDFFPFSEEKRESFDFLLLEETVFEETPVYVVGTRSRIKDGKKWEGKYYINKDTFDVLKMEIAPSKNPKHVKELSMEAVFRILPEGPLVLRRTKTRINAGIFIKRIRMIIEEEFSDYEILPAIPEGGDS